VIVNLRRIADPPCCKLYGNLQQADSQSAAG